MNDNNYTTRIIKNVFAENNKNQEEKSVAYGSGRKSIEIYCPIDNN
jgi:hypothetical protein